MSAARDEEELARSILRLLHGIADPTVEQLTAAVARVRLDPAGSACLAAGDVAPAGREDLRVARAHGAYLRDPPDLAAIESDYAYVVRVGHPGEGGPVLGRGRHHGTVFDAHRVAEQRADALRVEFADELEDPPSITLRLLIDGEPVDRRDDPDA